MTGGKLKIILLALVSLALLAGLTAVIITDNPEPDAPADQAGQNEPAEDEPEEDNAGQSEPKDDDENEAGGGEPSPEPPAARILPDDWDQMTIEQKMDLNPFDCPVEAGEVRLDPDTGACLEEPPAEPEPPEPAEPTSLQRVDMNQEFELAIGYYQLALNAESFRCAAMSEVILAVGGGHDLDEILDYFEKHGFSYSFVLDDDARPGVRDMIHALEYLDNFSRYLSRNASQAEIRDALNSYEECALTLTARNAGEDSRFPDGCGLDISGWVEAVAAGSRYAAEYIGPGYACTQAEVPFPSGDVVKTVVFFLLPQEAEITYFELSDGDPAVNTVRITAGPGQDQAEPNSLFY